MSILHRSYPVVRSGAMVDRTVALKAVEEGGQILPALIPYVPR